MKKLDNKLIIFDSNCRVCVSLRNLILAITPLSAESTLAYKALPAGLKSRVDENRFRNEMALVDLGSAETLYGAEGVMVVFSSFWPWFRFLMKLSVFRFLFRHFYKVVAFNRYVIALPRDLINCDCYPETNIFYRSFYILLCLTGSVLVTSLFGASAGPLFGVLPAEGAWHMLLVAGTGWLVQAILALVTARMAFTDYAGHLASIMFAGVLPLLITVAFMPLFDLGTLLLPALSVGISFPLMLVMHYRRVLFLGLSQWLTISWFFSLAVTAFFWIKALGYELP